jgi:hypothetical protein
VGSIVWHYTDTRAFAGLVETAQLWATDFRYLNDSKELIYAWDAFVEKLEQLAAEGGDYSEAYAAQLKALQLMNAVDLMDFDDAMFVACFTELGDALSQWSRYGANGRGFALGFDSDVISGLDVPVFHHTPNGQLDPVRDQHGTPFNWKAILQEVAYGDAERDRVVNDLLFNVRATNDHTGPGSFNHLVGNCVFQTHALVHRLPLVKHDAFKDEQEHRSTITEHLGGRSAGQRTALSTLPLPFSATSQGPLETLDTKFRPGGPTVFKPYVTLSFDRSALKGVVIGPAIKHHLAESTVRRMLDRMASVTQLSKHRNCPIRLDHRGVRCRWTGRTAYLPKS